jgi:hypothetical protein
VSNDEIKVCEVLPPATFAMSATDPVSFTSAELISVSSSAMSFGRSSGEVEKLNVCQFEPAVAAVEISIRTAASNTVRFLMAYPLPEWPPVDSGWLRGPVIA